MNNKIKFALFVGVPAILLGVGIVISIKRYLDLKSYVDTDMIDYCADCKKEKVAEHDYLKSKFIKNTVYGMTADTADSKSALNAMFGAPKNQNLDNTQDEGENMERETLENTPNNSLCRILTENGYSEMESPSKLVSHDDFFDSDFDEYDKLDWAYYCTDAIMADENNEVVENIYKFINKDFYNGILEPQFITFLCRCQQAQNMDDKMTLYVRTDVVQTDVEISVYPSSYIESFS